MLDIDSLYTRSWLYHMVCRARQVFYNWGIGRLTDSNKPLFLLLFPFAISYGSFMSVLCAGRAARQINEDLARPFDHELSVVAIMKNEAPYVREWIEYYRLLGATKFYLYDNDSSDNVKAIISDYINAGVVVYTHFPGRYRQKMAYTDAIKKYASTTRFMAVVDLDEFIVPVDEQWTLPDVLKSICRLNRRAAGVGIPWLMYGSSHNKERPEGLVIENYLYRAQESFTSKIKTVFNPRLATGYNNAHYPIYKYGAFSINENGKIIIGKFDPGKSFKHLRINHYFTKSHEEFRAKVARGTVSRYLARSAENFVQWDRNDLYDGIMLRYVPEIKRRMQAVETAAASVQRAV